MNQHQNKKEIKKDTKMEQITDFMKKEHEKIFNLLDQLAYKKETNLILELKRIIENHLFIEEKFIFKTSENEIDKLIKEHKEILWLLKIENFKELNKLLIEHTHLEINEFYPKLDSKLNEREKCLIINEMKSCKIYLI
jgi:hypothetical protein